MRLEISLICPVPKRASQFLPQDVNKWDLHFKSIQLVLICKLICQLCFEIATDEEEVDGGGRSQSICRVMECITFDEMELEESVAKQEEKDRNWRWLEQELKE